MLRKLSQAKAVKTDSAECVITDSSCPCAIHRPPGTCLQYKGGGTCLLGECNVAYKCDCFGFEICKISPCSIYTAGNLTVPSDIVPFSCQQTPNRGNCTTFKTFSSTITAGENAKKMATKYVSEVQNGAAKTVNSFAEILKDKDEADKAWEKMDAYAEKVTKDERLAVEAEVRAVVYAITQAQVEILEALNNQEKVFNANLEIGRIRAEARHLELGALQAELEAELELEKANEAVCTKCKRLMSKAEKLREKRRQEVIGAARWASVGREAKDHALAHVANVDMIREKSKNGLRSAQSKVVAIVARIQREGSTVLP